MEPLSALGIATGVIQFVDFTGNLISHSVKIYRARTKAGDHDNDSHHLETITEDLVTHNAALADSIRAQRNPQSSILASTDEDILRICIECEQIAAKLLVALRKLRSQKVTLWTSFLDALRTIWSEGDVRALARPWIVIDNSSHCIFSPPCGTSTPTHHQDTIDMSLHSDEIRTFQTRQYTAIQQTQTMVYRFFDKLSEKESWEKEVLRAMKDDYDQKRNTAFSLTSPAVEMKGRLSEQDYGRFQSGLLNWLRFTELETRYEKISPAYEATYEWVFRPPQNVKWSNFVSWLQGGVEPLFWITGKPAAGKSTLMKYIYSDSRTFEHLQTWAGTRKLIVLAFYFWRAGTQLQMSQEGFARTLLYEALQRNPELWSTLFPHKMEEYIAFGNPWRYPITWDEMIRALRRFSNGAGKEYKLFIFIDGLDEFDGNHERLISLIQNLLSQHVKICVSSRPWNVFEDAFQQRPSLRLEDLTYPDIKLFVTSRFLQNKGFEQLRMLDQQVADELIENDLQARLNTLPGDLEELFERVLTKDSNLARAAEMFQIMRTSQVPLSLLMLSYVDEADPEIAFKVRSGRISAVQSNARAEIMRRRLNACCKGLIESRVSPGEILATTTVGYLHRTVKDYIERDDIWAKLLAATDSRFDPLMRNCNAVITILKTSNIDLLESQSPSWDLVGFAIEYAQGADPGCATGLQVKLLNELDVAISYHTSLSFSECDPTQAPTKLSQKGHWSAYGDGTHYNTSFLHFAIQYQLIDYVAAVIGSSVLDAGTLASLLYVALNVHGCTRIANSKYDLEPRLPFVELLLNHNACPNFRLPVIPVDPHAWVGNGAGDECRRNRKMSAWECYIKDLNANRLSLNDVGKVLLENGADPNLVDKSLAGFMWSYVKKKQKEYIAHVAEVSSLTLEPTLQQKEYDAHVAELSSLTLEPTLQQKENSVQGATASIPVPAPTPTHKPSKSSRLSRFFLRKA
ncbi:hypothetical protein BCR34DRAFT_602605 [Clohesyomyces aquaticus]|uniref:NACHT domain-containing protein n=1 Tax=Clohesyomyces aquaticus TaxID=1231657 RepID=A0A1Y1ZHL7_9PLEO|nr:hypothetical protein BCR34DRAFT_602605 [Clohesyomyces aquaticus]